MSFESFDENCPTNYSDNKINNLINESLSNYELLNDAFDNAYHRTIDVTNKNGDDATFVKKNVIKTGHTFSSID